MDYEASRGGAIADHVSQYAHEEAPDIGIKLVSADSHITEPPNCYSDYIDPAFRDPFFRIDEGMKRCVPHANGDPKRSLYVSVYRVVEHLQVSALGPLYLATSDGRVAGLDKAGMVLSAEHDVVYVNQAEELALEDWETMTTRTTGRAGHMPYAQTIGDCNPSYPSHWMYHRDSLRMFYSRHEENPALYDPATGEITAQGERTMSVLDALTGVRKQRLRYGVPAQAEGAVYDEWDQSIHLIYADQVPKCTRHIASQDWGYTNAGVLGVWAIDGDGGMYLVAQVYQTGRTIDWWKAMALDLDREYNLEALPCDPAEPAYIDAYRQAGLPAFAADNAVLPGINAVKQRLAARRLFVVRDSLRRVDESLAEARKPSRVEDEFAAYVWADKTGKETPVKEHDHGMDMVRYAVMHLDQGTGPLLLWGDR